MTTHLPSQRSYLALPSLPSLPSSILSPPLPTSLSMPSFQSHYGLEQQPHHHSPFSPVDRTHLSSPPRAVPFAAPHVEDDGDSFLLHTASALVLSALEQKGYFWLAARKSSTSLTLSSPTSPTFSGRENFSPNAIHSRVYSHRSSAMNTPRAVRSRHHSRRSSASKSAPATYEGADFVQRESVLQQDPDFDLNDARNERAAAMNAESEIQNLLMERVGGWLEWVVGWMDFRDDDDDCDDYEVNETLNAGNSKSLPAKASEAHDHKYRQIRRNIYFREGIKETSVDLDRMKTSGDTPMEVKIESTVVSESKLDIEHQDRDDIRSEKIGTPLSAPTFPQVSSLLDSGAEAEAGIEARAGNWAGDHDVWWGDTKWLFGVAGKVAW